MNRMKRGGGLLKARGGGRPNGNSLMSNQDKLTSYKPVNPPKKTEKGAGSLFQRIVTRRKKGSPDVSKSAATTVTTPIKKKSGERQLFAPTPVTVASDVEIEVPLGMPERVLSYAETENTHEISQFSGHLVEEELEERQEEKAVVIKEKRNKPIKRSSSARAPSSKQQMVLDTSAIPFGKSRSVSRLARKTGNESVGDAQPDQPRRGFLPPLLQSNNSGDDDDDDKSASESTCSGITMDFTYGENMQMNSPLRQTVGRLGEGVGHRQQPRTTTPHYQSFVPPPSYIIMDDDADNDSDSYGENY